MWELYYLRIGCSSRHATETQELAVIHYFSYSVSTGHKRIILISFQNLELLQGRSSSPVGYGIGIAEVVGSNPTRSISIILVIYGIELSLIWEVVGQIQQ
jgi:hypothetical protein